MRAAAVVVGGSAGALAALEAMLSLLPADFAPPILLVQHLHASDNGAFAAHLARLTRLPVVEPCDKQAIEPGCVYGAPANYHMLVEADRSISLSVDARVNWSRPAIDVLFESAARVWGEALVAVLLSGANGDGTEGLRAVHAAGGRTLAQDPASAQSRTMPESAIAAGVVDEVLTPEGIGKRLIEWSASNNKLRG